MGMSKLLCIPLLALPALSPALIRHRTHPSDQGRCPVQRDHLVQPLFLYAWLHKFLLNEVLENELAADVSVAESGFIIRGQHSAIVMWRSALRASSTFRKSEP